MLTFFMMATTTTNFDVATSVIIDCEEEDVSSSPNYVNELNNALAHLIHFLKGHCQVLNVKFRDGNSLPCEGLRSVGSSKEIENFWDKFFVAFLLILAPPQ